VSHHYFTDVPEDSDDDPPPETGLRRLRPTAETDFEEPAFSSWVAATHGPTPRPAWVITEGEALDEDLGVLKTGKEADVSLLRRYLPSGELESGELSSGFASPGAESLMAAKRYRPAERRLFHRDAGYTEGRRVRRSRENRAMSRRTEFGRELLAGQWAAAEFAALSWLWKLGVAVPYPVQLLGTELLLEFIGDPDGQAAPRLAQYRPSPAQAADLYDQCQSAMGMLATAGWAHGDLSPYNLLVHEDRLVLIDLPQIVDIAANPLGADFLRRDCVNVCRWFAARGVAADAEELFGDLMAQAVSRW
jgi:RIO kinase 1